MAISSQQGPLIFRSNKNSSKEVDVVPKICENVRYCIFMLGKSLEL